MLVGVEMLWCWCVTTTNTKLKSWHMNMRCQKTLYKKMFFRLNNLKTKKKKFHNLTYVIRNHFKICLVLTSYPYSSIINLLTFSLVLGVCLARGSLFSFVTILLIVMIGYGEQNNSSLSTESSPSWPIDYIF